jgi:hypothetical protein
MASSLTGLGCAFPGIKRQESETDRSPPSSAEVKNGGAIPQFPDTSALFERTEQTKHFLINVDVDEIECVHIKKIR